MNNVIKLPAPNYFGDCPKCRRNNGYLNIGRDHWFVCKKHGVKWYGGSNIFPDWRQETEKTWRQNEALLENLMEVEPVRGWGHAVPSCIRPDTLYTADVISIASRRIKVCLPLQQEL